MPSRAGMTGFTCVAAVLLAGLCLAQTNAVAANAAPPPFPHFADADDSTLAAMGAKIYASNCSNCHGRRLQGQALWQLNDQYAGRRAPAHDATGHTWQHGDEDLFQMTKFGHFPAAPPGAVSYMPAFSQTLDDASIVAVIAFIKSRWPLGLRASQAVLNPGQAGMPANADKLHWTLPPNCMESIQGWSQTSK